MFRRLGMHLLGPSEIHPVRSPASLPMTDADDFIPDERWTSRVIRLEVMVGPTKT